MARVLVRGLVAGCGDVGAAGVVLVGRYMEKGLSGLRIESIGNGLKEMECLRREESSLAGQDGDVDVVAGGDLVHGFCELVVLVAIERVEFLGRVEGDYGDFAFVFDLDAVVGHDEGFNIGIKIREFGLLDLRKRERDFRLGKRSSYVRMTAAERVMEDAFLGRGNGISESGNDVESVVGPVSFVLAFWWLAIDY